jgi:hypothetical protein
MKKAVLATMILAGTMFAGPRFGIGINFGVAAPVIVRPVCPGPGYVWRDGFYAPNGVWVAGYWALPPAPIVYGVGPRYEGPRYVAPRFGARFEDHRGFRR